jgi:tRNA (guanine10-N2)-dimethyltransferase
MKTVLFYLGREPLLSLAELCSSVEADGTGGTVRRVARSVAALEPGSPIDAGHMIRRLGGTVRIGEPLEESPVFPAGAEDLAGVLVPHLVSASRERGSKINFGISLYPDRGTPRVDLKRVAGIAKERLAEAGVSARYVLPLRGTDLSAAQTTENRLDTDGIEFLVTGTGEGLLLARTRAVQAVTEEAGRDMQKPDRRLREGLLPPKIARIMVNLARRPGTSNLLDPFCGSGVVLMEAALLGLRPVGSDRSDSAVSSARKNLEWLLEREARPEARGSQVFQADVQDLSTHLPPLSMDAAATEPYLGPPLRGPLPDDKAESLSRELRDLYLRALAEIRIVLRPGGRCVLVTPVFRTRSGLRAVDVRKDLPLIGFREYNPLLGCEGVAGDTGLQHSRPGQNVKRNFLILANNPG